MVMDDDLAEDVRGSDVKSEGYDKRAGDRFV